MNINTQLLHSIPVDALTGSVSVPIYQTSTFVQEAPGVHKGFDYARSNNPTRQALEQLIATLEGGSQGLAFASGLAAIDAVVKLLRAGDEILAIDDLYGGAFRLFTQVYNQFDISIRYVDTADVDAVAAAIGPKTRLLWLETPSNPTLKISDITTIGAIAKEAGVLFCVDNTFASPIIQQPLKLGADLVVHSATKYLGGHSDLIAGLVVAKDEHLGQRLKFIQNASGGILAPFDSFLVIRGIETLSLRVQKHSENAQKVAEWLQSRPEVGEVYYPGLPNHRNHHIAVQQQKFFGGMVSFSLKNDDLEAAAQLVSSTKLFLLAESLGGAKSLVCHPAQMTHKSIPAEKRRSAGVADSLIRLSVGLEDADDLIADLQQALDRYKQEAFLPETEEVA